MPNWTITKQMKVGYSCFNWANHLQIYDQENYQIQLILCQIESSLFSRAINVCLIKNHSKRSSL